MVVTAPRNFNESAGLNEQIRSNKAPLRYARVPIPGTMPMNDKLDRLSQHVCSKVRTLGFSSPRAPVMRALLKTAFLASLKTEESRFPRGSLTFSDPSKPDTDPPPLRRGDYPSFTRLGHRTPLQTAALVKLFRAVNRWSGSLAVYGTHSSRIDKESPCEKPRASCRLPFYII